MRKNRFTQATRVRELVLEIPRDVANGISSLRRAAAGDRRLALAKPRSVWMIKEQRGCPQPAHGRGALGS